MKALAVAVLMLMLSCMPARAQEKYDPTTDPYVKVYMVCIQLASGGGDNSAVPDTSNFDEYGYVVWNDGTGKAILCQTVDKTEPTN